MPKDSRRQDISRQSFNGRGMRVYNAPVYHNAVPVRRPGGNARRCYRCRQVGHLARNCDSPCVVPAASPGASSSGPHQQQQQQEPRRQRQPQQRRQPQHQQRRGRELSFVGQMSRAVEEPAAASTPRSTGEEVGGYTTASSTPQRQNATTPTVIGSANSGQWVVMEAGKFQLDDFVYFIIYLTIVFFLNIFQNE
ncbi:unnamed protein product [Macrosiphum euphorbiae]|uniref:CCHC-type domain-containing protein n=1 Tax=Macrosiphum euphorbiae TaxID=13131 RepID=A0AAV0Y6X0_9HEMI|nr:unnamed protein product [Macrosiphum euphorbiae]